MVLVRREARNEWSPALPTSHAISTTGLSITSQLESLDKYEVYSLNIPPINRDSISQLSDQIISQVKSLASESIHVSQEKKNILIGESFGAVVALMVASRSPQLFQHLVLINPASNFRDSLGGLSSFITQTKLLASFPSPLYTASQAALLPLMFDATRIKPSNLHLVKKMMDMDSPEQLTPTAPEASPIPSSSLPLSLQPSPAAAAASHRCSLLQKFSLNNVDLSALESHTSTLIISSARDRLLPSLSEGSRLLRAIPKSIQVILPLSGHACLLERDVDLGSILDKNLNPALLNKPQASLDQSASNSEQEDPFALWTQRLGAWRAAVDPFVEDSNLPQPGSALYDRPILLVGNHGSMGWYDTPLLTYELYLRGYKTRGLADPAHWDGPVGAFFEQFGAVRATPLACYKLLRDKQKVLLFPGGGKEVVKGPEEAYQLLWDDNPGLMRMAAKTGALVIPFACLGADDAYEQVMSPRDLLSTPIVGDVMRSIHTRIHKDPKVSPKEEIAFFPITRSPLTLGLPSIVPIPARLERLYIRFQEPIDASGLDVKDEEAMAEAYERVKRSVYQGIDAMKERRETSHVV